MKEELLTDAMLRKFLLGKVDEAERERLENLFLTDSEAREKVLVVEQELVEDYLENSLTREDRREFLARYGQTPEQQQQLQISKAIKDWAVRENARIQLAPVPRSSWSRFIATLRMRPVLIMPIAATLLIAIVLVAFWVNNRMTRNTLAQELAELNTPASLRQTPQKMVRLNLSPVTVRGSEPGAVLKRSADNGIVELRLPLIQKEQYQTFRAEVRRVGGDQLFTIPDLQRASDDPNVIQLRFPVRILSSGDYQVRLTRSSNDANGPTEEYSFYVER